MKRSLASLLVFGLLSTTAHDAAAFVPADRWTRTATNFSTGAKGDPITVTWGIVPDGTSISGEDESSNLISFLDGIYGGGVGPISDRPWFDIIDQAFGRWSELGGLQFQYEPADDGETHGSANGALGVRADVRIAGALIDGDSGTLAYNSYPNGGDMVIDTGDGYFDNTLNDSRRLRNVLMHEAGHGFGLGHIESSLSKFLLEPFISTSFDGPQYDDIRGIQHLYGDAFEKANNGAGNDSSSNAIDLGLIGDGEQQRLGGDTGFNTSVLPTEVDFVSIANNNDIDFYAFTIDGPSMVDVLLDPVGATFSQAAQGGTQSSINTATISNLALALFDQNGSSILASANEHEEGEGEAILGFTLEDPGEYYVRITGNDDTVQFYELEIAIDAIVVNPVVMAGDYDQDGFVTLTDYSLWRDTLGSTGPGLSADGNNDLVVNQADYTIWKANFGATLSSVSTLAAATVPEPGSWALATVGLCVLGYARRRCS